MHCGRLTALIVLSSSVMCQNTANAPVAQNVYVQDLDGSVRPGDDFYRYANGTWLRTVAVPPGQTSYDNRALLKEKTNQRVREIIQGAAAAKAAKGSIAQKVGDYYASFMDQTSIQAKGMSPLADE